jgi:hypothetical protein
MANKQFHSVIGSRIIATSILPVNNEGTLLVVSVFMDQADYEYNDAFISWIVETQKELDLVLSNIQNDLDLAIYNHLHCGTFNLKSTQYSKWLEKYSKNQK